MKDLNKSEEIEDRIQSWVLVMILRLYGQNIYSDDSYVWDMLDKLDTVKDVDLFFKQVLNDFRFKHRDLSRLYKLLLKNEDFLGR